MGLQRSAQLVDVVGCHFRHDETGSYWIAVLDDVAAADGPLPMLAHIETLLQMHCPCARCGQFVDSFEEHLECGAGEAGLADFVVLRVHPAFVTDVRQAADRDLARAKSRAAYSNRRRQVAAGGRTHSQEELRALYQVQEGRCFYCWAHLVPGRFGNMAEDHFVALARGGHDGIDNIVLACKVCNGRKVAGDGFSFLWASEDAAEPGVRDLLLAMHRRHRTLYPALWEPARGRKRPRRR